MFTSILTLSLLIKQTELTKFFKYLYRSSFMGRKAGFWDSNIPDHTLVHFLSGWVEPRLSVPRSHLAYPAQLPRGTWAWLLEPAAVWTPQASPLTAGQRSRGTESSWTPGRDLPTPTRGCFSGQQDWDRNIREPASGQQGVSDRNIDKSPYQPSRLLISLSDSTRNF